MTTTVSTELQRRLVLSRRPQYYWARAVARCHPDTLSRLLRGAAAVRPDDRRIIALGRALGLEAEACFSCVDSSGRTVDNSSDALRPKPLDDEPAHDALRAAAGCLTCAIGLVQGHPTAHSLVDGLLAIKREMDACIHRDMPADFQGTSATPAARQS